MKISLGYLLFFFLVLALFIGLLNAQTVNLSYPENNAICISKQPTFKWNSVGATKYSLQFSSSTRYFWGRVLLVNPIIVTGIKINSYYLEGHVLEKNKKYYWQVGATNYSDKTTWSEIYSFTTNRVPEIKSLTHLPVDPQINQTVQVKATIDDDGNMEDVTLLYRNGGDSVFTSRIMSAALNNDFIFTFNEQEINSKALEYYILAEDKLGDFVKSSHNSITVTIPDPGIQKTSQLLSGRDRNRYQIISFPLDLDNNSAIDIIADDLGKYDKKKWRLFDYQKMKRIEYSDSMKIESGRGYWLIVANENKKIDTGAGKTYSTIAPFRVVLSEGYNLIGNPFNFSIPIHNISLDSNATTPELLKYNKSWQSLTDSLRPFEGFAIYSDDSTNLILNPNLPDKLNKNKLEQIEWSIQIIARCQDAEDSFNFAGVSKTASLDYDLLDYPEPPVIGEYISLYFPHPEWKKLLNNYCRDIRSENFQGNEWIIALETNLHDRIELQFLDLESLPSEIQVYLVDEIAQITQDLRKINSYYLSACSDEKPRHLKLLIGNLNYLDQKLDDFTEISNNYLLIQNFPNPFNPSTTIVFELPESERVTLRILNTLGQEVAVPILEQEFQAGRHAFIWDAKGRGGEKVATGVYFYQIIAGHWMDIKKMVLLP